MAKRQAGRVQKHEEERQRIEPFLRTQRAAKDGLVENATLSLGTAPVVTAQKAPPAWAC